MKDVLHELTDLFEEAKHTNEFEFVLTLINFRGMGNGVTNLYEWFDALEFYKRLYIGHSDKEMVRIGCLLYSTFFESSDFYNVLGSLCRIKMRMRGSSYLFYKTEKR